MREKIIENDLRKAVLADGGLCPKFVSPGMDGMPDRLVLLPGGRIAFVEAKAPGKKPRPLQLRRHEQLRRLGFDVYVLDDPGQVPGILREVMNRDPA
ncbi:MAG: VRR-NUC domain-containing protein [Clostridia bacterium]|nr:VRR-NUC domain-containing protein [Clostridia bacterium]